MKLLRVGPAGHERPAVLDIRGTAYDLTPLAADIDGAFLAGGGLDRARTALADGVLPVLDTTGVRIGSPVARPGKGVCIGLNYADHAVETSTAPPAEPVVFLKAANTVVGPDDTVLIPRGSAKTDSEVELAVVADDFPHLREGDVVEAEIDGLGRQRHVFGQA